MVAVEKRLKKYNLDKLRRFPHSKFQPWKARTQTVLDRREKQSFVGQVGNSWWRRSSYSSEMVYLKPFQLTSHKVFISTSKSVKQGCHIEIATFAYYLTMNGRGFLAISFLFMSSLESSPLPHSKIQMTGSWDEMYCECLKPDSFMALFGIYSPIQRYHRISQAVVRLQVLNLTCQTKNASCSSTHKSPPGQCTCTCGRDSQREQIPPWVDELFGTSFKKRVRIYRFGRFLGSILTWLSMSVEVFSLNMDASWCIL